MNHEDEKRILEAVVSAARRAVEKYGEFQPFAAAVGKDGKVEAIAVVPPEADGFVKSLRQGAQSGRYRASGLCLNVSVTDPETGRKSDAISISIDSAEGDAVDCIVPYEKKKDGCAYGELFAEAGTVTIFRKKAR